MATREARNVSWATTAARVPAVRNASIIPHSQGEVDFPLSKRLPDPRATSCTPPATDTSIRVTQIALVQVHVDKGMDGLNVTQQQRVRAYDVRLCHGTRKPGHQYGNAAIGVGHRVTRCAHPVKGGESRGLQELLLKPVIRRLWTQRFSESRIIALCYAVSALLGPSPIQLVARQHQEVERSSRSAPSKRAGAR